MKYAIHKELIESGRWFEYSLLFQLANIGSEISRTINWKDKDLEYSKAAFFRALELIDFTMADPKNRGPRLREIARAREALVDHFMYDNVYNTTDECWNNYFYQFAYAAALERGR